MKLGAKNLIVLFALIGALGGVSFSDGIPFGGGLPCFAKLDGNISKNSFYDTEKTIMPDVTPDTALQTGKYWEKNLFYINKYRPLFMLSNKDLYNLVPEKKLNVVQTFSYPTIYNISLKGNSVKKISFSSEPKKIVPKVKVLTKVAKQPIAKIPTVEQKQELQSKFLFEQAKNQGVEADKKIDAALVLKETKKPSNYLLALDLLDDVTRTEPYNAIAYNIKAEIYLAKNDPQNAMKNYIEVLNLNPYSKESCLGIAKILEPTNKALAQKYYERANQTTAFH